MQTLWARVVPRGSVNCSSSFSAAGTISRRATTAPIRRRLGLDDVFAAFFSTVAFASTVADSNRKAAKQNEWARVIKEAKGDLIDLKAQQQRRISNLTHPAPIARVEELADIHGQTWEEVITQGDGQIRDRKALGFEDWQGIPLNVLRSASREQIQDFLSSHLHHFRRFRSPDGLEVWNTVTWPLHIKKLRTVEWANAYLALNLMSHAFQEKAWNLPPDDQSLAEKVFLQLSIRTASDIQPRLDHIKSQLDTLSACKKSSEYYYQFETPKLPQYSTNSVHDSAAEDQLNSNLHALFNSYPLSEARSNGDSQTISQLVPRICFHLLTSSSPPTIHTYNLLISGLIGARRNDLISHILTCLYRSHMRPNEVTLVETLRHYIRTNDCRRFDRHVLRMDGFEQALCAADPKLDIPDLLKSRYRVRITSKDPDIKDLVEYCEYSKLSKSDIYYLRRDYSVKVYEKSRCNLEVYQTLIQGALHFHGKSEAIKHYGNMVSDGWEPDQEVFISILHRCVVDHDWDACLAVWRRLQTPNTTIDDRAYLLMIQLCQNCNRPQFIPEILHNGIARGDLPPTVLEMGWQETKSPLDDTQDNVSGLDVARDIWVLKHDLRTLLPASPTTSKGFRAFADRINVITSQIEKLVPRPSLGTTALLHEARSQVVMDRQLSLINNTLRDLDGKLLTIVAELQDIQSLLNFRKLEAQLSATLSSIAEWLAESKEILFSTQLYRKNRLKRLNGLEDRFKMLSAFLSDIQFQMSRYVVSYLMSHVLSLCFQLQHWSHQIRGTSKQIRDVVHKIKGEAVTIKNSNIWFTKRSLGRIVKSTLRTQRLSATARGKGVSRHACLGESTSVSRKISDTPEATFKPFKRPSVWGAGGSQSRRCMSEQLEEDTQSEQIRSLLDTAESLSLKPQVDARPVEMPVREGQEYREQVKRSDSALIKITFCSSEKPVKLRRIQGYADRIIKLNQ
ncbi:MAG: hypothetical protein Q9182_006980 [Xanthomendoza sp. 2 TL-2023]